MIRKFFTEHFDYKTFFTMLILIGIGIVSIYSATFGEKFSTEYSQKQLNWFMLGMICLFVTITLPLRFVNQFSFVAYIFSILMLVAVLVVGKTVSGSKSWIGLSGVGIQPSEIAKVGTILMLSSFMSRKETDLENLKDITIAFLILAIPIFLILLQPDVGTGLTFCGMFLPLIYWGGISTFVIVSIIGIISVGFSALFGTTVFLIVFTIIAIFLFLQKEDRFKKMVVIGLILFCGVIAQTGISKLKPHQQKRLTVFLNPESDMRGAGYNVVQSKIAIGSGGFLGKGFLKGTQTQFNFIPEQWTDFIFCVPGEEFGFLGSSIILILFLNLLLRNIRLASTINNRFGGNVLIGICSILFVHIIINVGMVIGLFPVIGVPLPFLSYGGSALLSNMIMIGLIMNIYLHRKEF